MLKAETMFVGNTIAIMIYNQTTYDGITHKYMTQAAAFFKRIFSFNYLTIHIKIVDQQNPQG
jgi:hypothetical protein